MLHESISNDQEQPNRGPASNRKSPWQVDRNVPQKLLGINCRTRNCTHVHFSLTWPGKSLLVPPSGRSLTLAIQLASCEVEVFPSHLNRKCRVYRGACFPPNPQRIPAE